MAQANNTLVRTVQRLSVGIRDYLPPHNFIVGLHLARGAQRLGWLVDRLFPIDSRFVSECYSFCGDRVQFRVSRSVARRVFHS
ncbi:hypothetical protein [Phormidesmis priestleyi]